MRRAFHLSPSNIAESVSEWSNGDRVRSNPNSAFDSGGASVARAEKPAILLIHSRPFLRDCFARCLQTAYDDHVVLSFDSLVGWRNSDTAHALTPSVAIIVLESADASSRDELLEDAPDNVPLIVVSDIEDSDQIVRTLKSGIRGYIPTNLPFNVAVEAVRLVGAGGVFVPASSFVHRGPSAAPAKSGVTVTQREMSVIEGIRRGNANKQIALDLDISEHTVKLHLRRIMTKLKARNRTEVAVLSKNVVARPKDC